jgi:hypothetical protein
MKKTIIPASAVVLFLTASCVGQGTETKETIGQNSPPAEIKGTRQQKASPLEGDKSRDYVPGEILVKFHKGAGKEVIENIQEKLNLETIRIVSSPNLYLMKIEDGDSVENVTEQLRDFQEVIYSEPNYVRRVH